MRKDETEKVSAPPIRSLQAMHRDSQSIPANVCRNGDGAWRNAWDGCITRGCIRVRTMRLTDASSERMTFKRRAMSWKVSLRLSVTTVAVAREAVMLDRRRGFACAVVALMASVASMARSDESAPTAIASALAQWTQDFNAGRADRVCDLFAR